MANEIPFNLFRRTQNLYKLDTCVICQEKYKSRSDVVELACGHIFHGKCASPMDDCALCRTPLETTTWLQSGNYEEEFQEYLDRLEEEYEPDPVAEVRRYEDQQQQQHLQVQRRRKNPYQITAMKVGVFAIVVLGVYFCLFHNFQPKI